jgi:iron(III) transport system permease protein
LILLEKVVFSGPDGALSFTPYREVLASPSTKKAVINTLIVSSVVTLVCMLIGVPLAWVLSRSDFPQANRFRSWLCLPFAIPPYIGAIAWIFLANPTTGVLNRLVGEGTLNIYSMTGLIFVEASFLYTFILLTTLSSFDRMDSSFEEAARLSGASPFRVLTDISLPIIRPALFSGALLVFLATAASFGVPALIGGPARIYMMTTKIYTYQKMGSISGLLKAGALSSFLMFLAVLTLLAVQLLSRDKRMQTVSGKTARPSNFELGRWKAPIVTLTILFLVVVFVLPILGILISSLSSVQGELTASNFTLETWRRTLFDVTETGRAIKNSLLLATGAATVAAILGVFIGYIQTKTKLPGRQLLDVFASLPYATPGTVVALAMILTFSSSYLGILPSLYSTLTLIMVAYVVKYLSFAVKTTADGYRQIDDVLAEAARVSGATWTKTLTSIWLPLLGPALAAAWFLVFMPALSELTMTILLSGPNLETIGTVIFQLQEYADASGGGASVLAMVVVLSVILINFAVKRLSQGKYGL